MLSVISSHINYLNPWPTTKEHGREVVQHDQGASSSSSSRPTSSAEPVPTRLEILGIDDSVEVTCNERGYVFKKGIKSEIGFTNKREYQTKQGKKYQTNI